MQKVNDRGKIFTERMRKHPVEVYVTTMHGHIRGQLHVSPGHRVKDMLNIDSEQFLAVTNASLIDYQNQGTQQVGFIAVNKQHIISVIPINEPQRETDGDGYDVGY